MENITKLKRLIQQKKEVYIFSTNSCFFDNSGTRTRTKDQRIMIPLLYQLSYAASNEESPGSYATKN